MQEAIKNLLILIKEQGLSQEIYSAFHLLSFFVAVPFFMWLAKRMNVDRKRAFFALLINCIIFLVLMHLIGWIEATLGLGNFGRKNALTVYVWMPMICIIAAKLTKMDRNTLCTMMAITMPFIHAVANPGCLVAGCCKGFECSWGIYNINTEDFRFPMAAAEVLWKFILASGMLYLLKRRSYKPTKWLYPLMLVIFGILQFISEFFIDNAKIVGYLSLRSFHELSLILVGSVWLGNLRYNEKRKNVR